MSDINKNVFNLLNEDENLRIICNLFDNFGKKILDKDEILDILSGDYDYLAECIMEIFQGKLNDLLEYSLKNFNKYKSVIPDLDFYELKFEGFNLEDFNYATNNFIEEKEDTYKESLLEEIKEEFKQIPNLISNFILENQPILTKIWQI